MGLIHDLITDYLAIQLHLIQD